MAFDPLTWCRNALRERPALKRAAQALAAVAGLLLLIALFGHRPGGAAKEAATPTFAAIEGPLTISVTEAGTLQAREQVVIKCEVEGQAAIIFLIPEGTHVKEGDLLVELDASALQTAHVDQQIRAQNADAAFVRARENLEVVKNQAAADVAKAELDKRFADEDRRTYDEGEYPNKVKELESRIALAEEEGQRAKQKFEGSRVLFDEKYISQTELQADELASKKAALDVQLAREELGLLEEFTHKRRVDELTAAQEQMGMALERVKRKASADVVQAEADLRAKDAEFSQQKERLQKSESQLEKTKIRAPRDGLVVYATSTEVSWRGNQTPFAEGQLVRERQELIYLPTASSMKIKLKLPESRLESVKLDLPARVTVDALQGRVFAGRVARIAPLPDATSAFINPDLKVYDTDVNLDMADDALRTGMSCTVEIIVERYDKALYVPVHAVVRRGRQTSVYVRDGRRFTPRAVEIGMDNARMVHILSGLKAGEDVSLSPPLDEAAAEETVAEVAEGAPAAAPAPAPAPAPPAAASTAAAVPARPDASAGGAQAAEAPRPEGRGTEEASPEERERRRAEWQKRAQEMTPEQREKLREERQRRHAADAPEGGSPRP